MEFFKGIDKVKYEGVKTNNLLAFAHYNPEEVILGKKMKDHLKFAMSYWHTLTGEEQIHLEMQLWIESGMSILQWKKQKLE